MTKRALIVTTIQAPNEAMFRFSKGCRKNNIDFIVVGDTKTPPDFHLNGANYYGIDDQIKTSFRFAELCPKAHYARKNIGYLIAVRSGCNVIQESDDDNYPYDAFFETANKDKQVVRVTNSGWTNVYGYFSDFPIWPRGFSLAHLKSIPPQLGSIQQDMIPCPIQQGLCNRNPDVDAIYRLTATLPVNFTSGLEVALGENSWCPFNSQNTLWWKEAFPLLYLPAYCSFRMTDIWRGLIAQRIAWANGWSILFHSPTVFQERNEHDLLKDFGDEIEGYLNNGSIAERLGNLSLASGSRYLFGNLKKCYELLIEMGLIGDEELVLLEAWESDLAPLLLPTD